MPRFSVQTRTHAYLSKLRFGRYITYLIIGIHWVTLLKLTVVYYSTGVRLSCAQPVILMSDFPVKYRHFKNSPTQQV